ncbi:Unknown protein, partial [Striga hermonthica]
GQHELRLLDLRPIIIVGRLGSSIEVVLLLPIHAPLFFPIDLLVVSPPCMFGPFALSIVLVIWLLVLA